MKAADPRGERERKTSRSILASLLALVRPGWSLVTLAENTAGEYPGSKLLIRLLRQTESLLNDVLGTASWFLPAVIWKTRLIGKRDREPRNVWKTSPSFFGATSRYPVLLFIRVFACAGASKRSSIDQERRKKWNQKGILDDAGEPWRYLSRRDNQRFRHNLDFFVNHQANENFTESGNVNLNQATQCRFPAHLGAPVAVGVSSCTHAIMQRGSSLQLSKGGTVGIHSNRSLCGCPQSIEKLEAALDELA